MNPNILVILTIHFLSYKLLQTIGNHDSSSAAYNEHFNLPNESAQYGATTAGSDYWFCLQQYAVYGYKLK